MNTLADKIVNAVLFPFGHCRVKLAEEGSHSFENVLATIKQKGGVRDAETGFPAFDTWYFRMPGGRVRLTVIEYGETYLWGPKRLVRELAPQLSA